VCVFRINGSVWGRMSRTRAQLYLTTERFGRQGQMEHNCRVAYREGQTVRYIVDELMQTWEGLWRYRNLAYGAIKIQDGLGEDEWPVHRPRKLRWVVNREHGWQREMTVEELFADVALAADERFLLVMCELDLLAVHAPEGEEANLTAVCAREDVHGVAYWLYDLYFAAGGLRQLRRE
jgi:hypothetical protein